jgi:hypothetical protein
MNGNAMRKKLGPVADDIAMFLSGIDGFPHDLRDFSAVGARTWMSIVGFKMPSHLLPHSFDKHINNMLRHNFCDPGIRGTFVPGIRGFLVVQWMVQPLVETGSTGSHGFGEVAVCAGPTIWFVVVHFLLICFLMVSITHRVNRVRMHRVIPIHARMSVILTNIVVVMVNVFAGI